MARTNLEVLSPSHTYAHPAPAPKSSLLSPRTFAVVAAVLTLFGGVAGSYYQRALEELDEQQLARASSVWTAATADALRSLENETRVTVDDARIREPLAIPNIDDATLLDLLQELKAANGASMVGIVSGSGVVRVVSGADSIRGVNLAGSSLMKPSATGLSTGTWLFPEKLLAVAIAPVRLGQNVVAYFMIGREIGKHMLGLVEKATGATGGIVVQQQLVASTAGDETQTAMLIGAAGFDVSDAPVVIGDRVASISAADSSRGGKLVFVVPRQQGGTKLNTLRAMWWAPSVLAVAAMLIGLIGEYRRLRPLGRKGLMRALISGTVLCMGIGLFGGTARAGENGNSNHGQVDSLERDVRALRDEVRALRTALAELSELDRQRAEVIARVLQAASRTAVSRVEEQDTPPVKETAKESPRDAKITKVAAKTAARVTPPPATTVREVGMISGRVAVPSGEPVAYVYVENIHGGAAKGESVVIEQAKKQFLPNWAVIQRGTTIKFPNNDNIYHNVFSRTPGNSFDLGLYSANDEAKSHTFYEPGPTDIYCNIHPRMSASVLVVPNRYFVKVKADGTFELPDVPAGKRKVVAWAPSSSSTSEWIELAAGEKKELTLRLESKSGAHKNKDGRAYPSYE